VHSASGTRGLTRFIDFRQLSLARAWANAGKTQAPVKSEDPYSHLTSQHGSWVSSLAQCGDWVCWVTHLGQGQGQGLGHRIFRQLDQGQGLGQDSAEMVRDTVPELYVVLYVRFIP